MGACFAEWVESLEGQLLSRAKALPVVEPAAAAGALGVTEEHLRHMPGIDALCAYVLHVFRPALLEQAHGKDVEIAIVGVAWHVTGGTAAGGRGEAAIGVFGMIEDEKGVRQWEATIARVGPARFVVHAAAGGGPVGESSRQSDRDLARAARDSAPAGETTPHVPVVAVG
jgi:hypothetical protein